MALLITDECINCDVCEPECPNEAISAGEEIGMTGRTGNATAVHLHYEILVDGRTQNPLTIGD